MRAKYLFPIISLGPPHGYDMDYTFALNRLKKHCPEGSFDISISRYHYFNGKEVKKKISILSYDGCNWSNDEIARYKSKSIFKSLDSWNKKHDLEYIETRVEMLSNKFFYDIENFVPMNYTIYKSSNKKTFLSDNNRKYGESRTIDQIKNFKEWGIGYPDCNFSKQYNSDNSFLLINPFNSEARIMLTLKGNMNFKKKLKINKFSGIKVSLSSLIGEKCNSWSGQLFITGKNRIVIFLLKHMYSDQSFITSMEHLEHFRGEHTYYDIKKVLTKIKHSLFK